MDPDQSPVYSRIRQNPEVVSSRVGDGGILVHLHTNRIFELNATGVRIWELLAENRALSEIETVLQAEFDGDREQVRADLLALIQALAAEKLIDEERD
jgi:hypothetical protein